MPRLEQVSTRGCEQLQVLKYESFALIDSLHLSQTVAYGASLTVSVRPLYVGQMCFAGVIQFAGLEDDQMSFKNADPFGDQCSNLIYNIRLL